MNFDHLIPSEEEILQEKVGATGIVASEGKKHAVVMFRNLVGAMGADETEEDQAKAVAAEREINWGMVRDGELTKEYARGFDQAVAEIHQDVVGEKVSDSLEMEY